MPEKLDRCVREVRAKDKVRNAWAVCMASIYNKRKRKKKRTTKSALWKVMQKERMKKHG